MIIAAPPESIWPAAPTSISRGSCTSGESLGTGVAVELAVDHPPAVEHLPQEPAGLQAPTAAPSGSRPERADPDATG
jgi:hypothetical protein